MKENNCNVINELVELVDIFPTIAELANTPIKTCLDSNDTESNLCSEGYSMLPLIEASKTCEVFFRERNLYIIFLCRIQFSWFFVFIILYRDLSFTEIKLEEGCF